jgi:hypothetical protein
MQAMRSKENPFSGPDPPTKAGCLENDGRCCDSDLIPTGGVLRHFSRA